MLYIHETHHVIGGKMETFLEACRKGWLPLIEQDGLARLLWFWVWSHGTGPAYRAVSVIQVPDWKAWGELVGRYQRKGDPLHDWYEEAWKYRRKVEGKVMTPVEWSPIPKLPPPGAKAEHPPTVYLHDVAYPYPGHVEQYIETLGRHYYPYLGPHTMLSMELCLRVAPGAGDVHEVVLVQKINDTAAFSRLITQGEAAPVGPGQQAPGRQSQRPNWMEVGLTVRDQWLSQVLRTLPWSPLY